MTFTSSPVTVRLLFLKLVLLNCLWLGVVVLVRQTSTEGWAAVVLVGI
jgi:hypothetical protein